MKMCSTPVHCPKCGGNNVKSFGYSAHNVPRYFCCNAECETKSFMLEYRYKAYEPGVKEKVVDMAINGGGIRDTSRVLGINKKTVINTLKKRERLSSS
ncbi:IS1-like element transposase [Endozoicomonas euniceicola]|uniref:IS1-like element transposase n=1 Tax=Endozoicomonas euniceicola TaxID=1234143 RepID=A0ABY6GQR2_9GAMM|nr:IS1-like element transposase [Endozoicomonas euniceicola]UYM14344.1 IS1-like element transposase [Endozoicomonas euniceicola]